jgi:hypothetical protein
VWSREWSLGGPGRAAGSCNPGLWGSQDLNLLDLWASPCSVCQLCFYWGRISHLSDNWVMWRSWLCERLSDSVLLTLKGKFLPNYSKFPSKVPLIFRVGIIIYDWLVLSGSVWGWEEKIS